MDPAVGRSRPTISFATVVFPEPDSPTIASEPPSGSVNETSLTATSAPNSLRRSLTSSTGSAMDNDLQPAAQLFSAGAAREPAAKLDQGGPRLAANVHRMR